MGDTGSLLIGLVNSILVIKFINIAGAPGGKLPIEAAPAVGFAVLIVPLFDTLRVFSHRILDRRSPFSPDRTHVHHFLLELGFNHKKITLACAGANIGFIILAVSLRSLGTTMLIGVLLAVAITMIAIVYYSRPSRKLRAYGKLVPESNLIKARKILSLSPEVEIAEAE